MPNMTPSQAAAYGVYQQMANSGYALTPQQQMILDSFDTETYVANKIDVQHEPIWDTIAYSNGASYPPSWSGPSNGQTITTSNSQFFVNVGSASGKTIAQTNIATSKKLDAPEAFAIFGFRLRIYEGTSLTDYENIFNNFALQFVIGNKPYNTGPLWFYQVGGGIFGSSTNSSTQFLTNGQPGREAMHKLAIPLVIENQASFYAQLVGNNYTLQAAAAGGAGTLIQLVLDGLHARGVQ